jgi:hypothetical protein
MQILKRLQQLPLNRECSTLASMYLCQAFIVVDEVADEFIAVCQ